MGTHATLTAWLALNENYPQADEFIYAEIPQHYVSVKAQKKWKRRVRGGNKIVTQRYYVSPQE